MIDVVLEMFSEESLFPTMEQAASRSGLSLRSLYRYFNDPGELLKASIERSRETGVELGRIHTIGQGSLDRRVGVFVTTRLRIYDVLGSVFRATVANAAQHSPIHDELAKTRNDMRAQFELQFAPELAACKPADRGLLVGAGDLITQLDSIDYLRTHRQLSVSETETILVTTLHSLLG